jgi:hypothetical protein
MTFLDSVSRGRGFRLASFDVQSLDFDGALPDDLLEEVAQSVQTDEPVVRPVHPAPTAGELDQSIQRHLRAQDRSGEAADDLHVVLSELRRSLG